MFHRQTGDVDPTVTAFWRSHYDISYDIETNWATLKPDLRGKIHLYVGTDDTFYLDGAAHRLQSLLEQLDGEGYFTLIPSRSPLRPIWADDKDALFDEIAAQMYAVARPRK
jgi:hypothetical protein